MPQYVRIYPFVSQRRTDLTGGSDMLRQQILETIVAQATTMAIWEENLLLANAELLHPWLQNSHCLTSERNAAFLSPFSQHMNMGTGAKMNIFASQP